MNQDLAALYNPEGVPLVSPDQIERALAALWRPVSDKPDAAQATRVSLGNLVLVGCWADWSELARTLSQLSPVYPTRTIVVLLEDAVVSGALVSVSAVCHVPQPNRPQVCCEQVLLRWSHAAVDDLATTVLPLLEGDVPVFLWWTLPAAHSRPMRAGLGALAHRTILDAGRDGLIELGVEGERELGWARTERWRAVVAGLFDECRSDLADRILNLTISLGGPAENDLIDAVWLASFVAGQCGWEPTRANGTNTWEFHHEGTTCTVMFKAVPDARAGFAGLTIEAGDSTFTIESCGGSAGTFRIHVADSAVCGLPRSIQIRPISRAEAVGRAMKARRDDPVFSRAFPIARFMAQSLSLI